MFSCVTASFIGDLLIFFLSVLPFSPEWWTNQFQVMRGCPWASGERLPFSWRELTPISVTFKRRPGLSLESWGYDINFLCHTRWYYPAEMLMRSLRVCMLMYVWEFCYLCRKSYYDNSWKADVVRKSLLQMMAETIVTILRDYFISHLEPFTSTVSSRSPWYCRRRHRPKTHTPRMCWSPFICR